MIKLTPDERLLIEDGLNCYKLMGPGLVLLMPWQKALTTFYIGPQTRELCFEGVRTQDNMPVKIKMQVIYNVDLTLLTEGDLLSKIPRFSEGVWSSSLQWRAEQVLQRLVAGCAWHKLGPETAQKDLEQKLTEALASHLEEVGLRITSVDLVKTELPEDLQEMIVESERDSIEPRGRASFLEEYARIFGVGLTQAMPYIVQWELLNLLRKNGKPQLYLTSSTALSPDKRSPNGKVTQPIFPAQQPWRNEAGPDVTLTGH